MMKLDKQNFDYLVEKRLLTRQEHPAGGLFIYNYTPKCVFARAWTPETLMARGLILTRDGTVVARPLPKFFNLEEHPRSDVRFSKPFTVHEKFDGSLGILYWWDGEWAIATRGSFTSDQAVEGTKILQEQYWRSSWTEPEGEWIDRTFCFEIIYPANRIVVNYGEMRDLVLLAVIDNDTGNELDLSNVDWPGPKASSLLLPEGARIPPRGILDHFAYKEKERQEGFVLRWDTKDGPFRIKVKFDEYKRLHALVTSTSTKTIWEYCQQGWSIDELLENVPDEFEEWVREKYDHLYKEYFRIDREALIDFGGIVLQTPAAQIGSDGSVEEYWQAHRREYAELAKQTRYPAIMFCLLDCKPYDQLIWKMVRPEHETPFANTSKEDV